jgi:hypothetical protein
MRAYVGIACLVAILAAENPFAGTWKLNPAKSKLTGDTVTYERTESGQIRSTAGGLTYTFRLDGREYPAPLGYTAAWRQRDERTWETVNRLNGKLIGTDTITVSPDGRTRTVISKGAKPNGERFEDTAVYERVSGDAGLLGTWRSTEVKAGSPTLFRIAPYGEDGLTFTLVDYKATCNAKLDGKDYPATGPAIPPGFTLAARLTGERTLELVQKAKGKVLGASTYTLSADGRELTEVYQPAAVNEPVTAVYDRQEEQ